MRLELIFYLQKPLRLVPWNSFATISIQRFGKSYVVFLFYFIFYMGIFEIRLSLTFLIIFIDFNKSFDLYKRNFLI